MNPDRDIGRPATLTAASSDTYRAFLRHEERSEATETYCPEGATSTVINYLNGSESMAREGNIPVDEALSEVLKPPSTSTPRAVWQVLLGWGMTLLSVIFYVLGGVVFLFDFIAYGIINTQDSPCTPGNDFLGCGGSWTLDNFLFLGVVTAIGIGVIVLAEGLRRAGKAVRRRASAE